MRSGHSGRSGRAALSVGLVLTLSPVVTAVPAVSASAAPSQPPAPVAEAADERSATAAARRQGTEVEIAGLRSETSQTFALPNGRLRMDESLRPQRVRRADGTWAAADATLRRNADGTISPVAATMQMAFSGGGAAPMAAMTSGEKSVKLYWPNALPAPVLSGTVATYRSVLPGVDLEIRAEVDSFTHLVVIRTPKAAANPALSRLALRTELSGLSLRADLATDAVSAMDPSGTTVFGSPSPSMWDSRDSQPASGLAGGPDKASAAFSEPRRAPVGVELTTGKLTLVPDRGMLTDPDTVWPVYVDPTWSFSVGFRHHWTVLRQSEPGRSFYDATSVGTNDSKRGLVRAGRVVEDGYTYKDRSLFDMDMSGVTYKHVYRAVFSLTQMWAAPACTGVAGVVDLRELFYTFDRNTVWNTAWNTNGSGWKATLGSSNAIRKNEYSCGPARVEFDSTWYVQALARLGRTHAYYGLRGRTETGTGEWKRYSLNPHPALTVWYNTVPNAPTGLSADAKGCGSQAAPTWVTSATPIVSAQASDPDSGQQNLLTRFYWWEPGQPRTETNRVEQSTGNPGTPAVPVPAGRLLDDHTYAWQAVTFDDVGDAQWGGLCYLRVDSSPPNPAKAVTSTQYPTSGPHGGVGIPGTFTFTPPDLKKEEIVQYAYTLDSGVQPAQAPKVTASPVDRKATVQLTPRWDGPNTLRVWTVDAAQRASTTAFSYTFTVTVGSGELAMWQFDSPSACATVDGSQHGNTVTVTGATCTAGRAGVGSALLLDGVNDYAGTSGQVMYPPAGGGVPIGFRTDADLTVTAWVRLTAIPTSNKAIVAVEGVRTSPFWLGYEVSANRWRFRMSSTDTDSPPGTSVLSDAAPVAGRWTHVAGVYDAQTKKLYLYINGELQTSTATLTAGGFNATGPLVIGRQKWNGSVGYYWPGAIDDVRVYQTVLSAAVIDDIADPLPPVISFPNGASVQAGGQIAIRFDAAGDANVTSFVYSVGAETYNLTATPAVPGGQTTVNVLVSVVGTATVYVRAVDITADLSATTSATFTVLPAASLSGTIREDATNAPVVGATVRLEPGGLSATSGAGGSFSFNGLTAATYTLAATFGDRCALFAATPVDVIGATTVDLFLSPLSDAFGYTCRVELTAFTPADATVLSLSGDDAVAPVSLPFALPFYDQSYSTAWVETNGILSFVNPNGSHPHDGSNIPAPAEPNAMIAPFWDDLVVDGAASVRTATLGSAPSRQFVVEWRNVHRKGNTTQRITFEAILSEGGRITFNYASLDGTAEQGEHATVGIESPGGEIGIQYSYLESALVSGTTVVFDFPGDPVAIDRFDLSGVVTDPAGSPVAGTTVMLSPAEVSVTTAADGRYTFDDLESGRYTATVATGARCGLYGLNEVDLVADVSTANVGLARISDETGTTCSDGPRTFVPADDTVLALTGDDEYMSISLPFPITLYGQSYTTAWVDTNGVMAFEHPFSSSFQFGEIPSIARPNGAVYPFWADWWVDAAASVRTATTGTAPNRQFIVEWRNVHVFGDPGTRVTFEVVFAENGQIAFAYADIDATAVEQGESATVGIENADGTVGLQYLYHEAALSSGLGVVFQPGPPHTGSVAGTLTCDGTAVSGAQISVAGQTVATTATGGYQLTGVGVGQYSVVATAASGTCRGTTAAPVTVTKDIATVVDIALSPGAGYAMTVGPRAFTPANDSVLGVAGDDEFGQVSLPFPITLYGQTYTTAWVDTNGVATFELPTASFWDVSEIPSTTAPNRPNAAVYPFWADWWVDASASVRTATTGTAPNRQFIVEWRNIHAFGDANLRASFEVIFYENGDIAFAYDIGSTFTEQGGNATVGIENAAGTIAVQYLHRHPALRQGDGPLFHPV